MLLFLQRAEIQIAYSVPIPLQHVPNAIQVIVYGLGAVINAVIQDARNALILNQHALNAFKVIVYGLENVKNVLLKDVFHVQIPLVYVKNVHQDMNFEALVATKSTTIMKINTLKFDDDH